MQLLKKIIIFILYLVQINLFSQYSSSVKNKLLQIDSLYAIDEEKAIQISNELVKIATTHNNKKLYIQAQLIPVQLQFNRQEYYKAIKRVKKLIEIAKSINNEDMLTYSLSILSNFYSQLGLNDESEQINNELFNIIKDKNTSQAYITKGNIYNLKIQSIRYLLEFNKLNIKENKFKILNYARKAQTEYNKLPTTLPRYHFFKITSLNLMFLAHYKLNNVDSAQYYREQIEYYYKNSGQLKNNNMFIYFLNFNNARTYVLQKKYIEALSYYNLALKNINKISSSEYRIYLYKDLSKTYNKLSDTIKSKKYTLKYLFLKDSINKERNKIRSLYHNKSIQESNKKESEKYYIFIISLIILLLLISLFFIFYKKKKRELTDQTNKTLVLNNLDKLLELAKSNDILFQTTFNELYPEFIAKIPTSLTEDEIKICSMIKLNFSSKEISQYTFTSIRTIENKRYRIRKKLDLDTKTKLNQYLKNL